MPYSEVMGKFKRGKLHSGSPKGPEVTNRKQAVAIMLSEKREAEKGNKEYQPKGYDEGGPVKKDIDIPLPSLKKGETGPQSPTVTPKAKPELYWPSSGDRSGPAMMARKGGPMKKYEDGGDVKPTNPLLRARGTGASDTPEGPPIPNANLRARGTGADLPEAPIPNANLRARGRSQGYNKGGEVKSSSNAQKAQNLVETVANPTGRIGLKKGGEVTGRGWRRWGMGT